MATPSPSPFGGPGRRRNGRMQACEPCRRRKVACDHAFPVCGRCRAKKAPGGCIYVLGPSREPRRRVGVSDMAAHGSPTGNTAADTSQPVPSSVNGVEAEGPGTADPGPAGSAVPSSGRNPGYLGFTSFSSIYEETQNSLSLVQGNLAISSMRNILDSPGANTGDKTILSSKHLEKCLFILQRLPDKEHGPPLFTQHINQNDGWIRLAGKTLMESLYTAFGPHFRTRSARDLQDIAQKITANTAHPWLEEDEPDAARWMASISGLNLRWECVGIICTYWSIACGANRAHRPDLSDGDHPPKGIQDLMLMYKEMCALCIDLCRGCTPNSLLLYLMFKNSLLESILSGDASPTFWRHQGEVVALVTYLGLHAIPSSPTYVPTASSESKRRLVSQIFNIDKVAASFSGRPPLLSRKYLLTPLPLDVSDEALLADADTLSRAVQSLDENGWNTEGRIYSTTICRSRCSLSRTRDEIMEISMGNPADTSVETLLALKDKENRMMYDFPAVLKFRLDNIRSTAIDNASLYTRMIVHLEHLQALFFIHRLLLQRGHDSHGELLSVSFEMVSVTLVFWTHMDRLAGLHADFEWLVMAFAAPAGGILCNELLKPSLHSRPVPGVARAGVIQQLSLLVGFLDWVSPSAPNGDLCSSCKAVIQHVLDQSLNVQKEPLGQGTENAFDLNLDLSSDLNGYFNFDLLDTFDWLRPDGITSSQGSGA